MEDKTIKEIYESMTEEQKLLVTFIVKKAIEEKEARIAYLEAYILVHELTKED